MPSSPSPRRPGIVRAGGLVLALSLIGSGLATGQTTDGPGNAAGRANARKTNADRGRTARGPRDTRTGAGGSSSPLPTGLAASYRLTPGKTFGYHVEIRVETRPRIERFVGTSIFTVRSVDREKRTAVLGAIGRLACFTTPRGTGNERARPSRDVWIGTRIEMDLSGRGVSGRDDYNGESLPDALQMFTDLKHLVFVDLPATTPGAIRSSGTRTLFFRSGSFSNLRTIEGRETYSVRSAMVSAALARLEKRHRLLLGEGEPVVFRYEGTSLFDCNRGLPISNDVTLTEVEGKSQVTTKVTVRLLEGDYLERALASSKDDWKDLPPSLDPVEFRRVRLGVKELPRLRSPAEAVPGRVVGHFRDGDFHWYVAEIVKMVSRYDVKIRYRGSLEELDVNLGQLGIPPAGSVPGT